MNWDDVRVFVVLVRCGSLSRAGRELKVEHSTVVRRIDSLEKALGVRLFDRMARGWSLTTEGEQLFARAEQMEETANALLREADEGAALTGKVRLSALPAFSAAFLVPRLAACKEKWAAITLELVAETRLVSLTRREADLALRLGRPQDPTVTARRLGTIRFGLFATPAYLNRNAPDAWRFLAFDDSLRDTPEQQWLEKYAEGREYSLASNSSLALLQAAEHNLGVAVLPYFLASGSQQLVAIASNDQPPSRDLWLVIHPEVRRSARVRLIADLVTDIVTSADAVLNPTAASQGPL